MISGPFHAHDIGWAGHPAMQTLLMAISISKLEIPDMIIIIQEFTG